MSVKSRFIAISANAVLNSYYIFTIYQNDLAHNFCGRSLASKMTFKGIGGAEGPVDLRPARTGVERRQPPTSELALCDHKGTARQLASLDS